MSSGFSKRKIVLAPLFPEINGAPSFVLDLVSTACWACAVVAASAGLITFGPDAVLGFLAFLACAANAALVGGPLRRDAGRGILGLVGVGSPDWAGVVVAMVAKRRRVRASVGEDLVTRRRFGVGLCRVGWDDVGCGVVARPL